MNLSIDYECNFRCVALLYALFNNDLNVEVSDTTKMRKEQKVKYKQIFITNKTKSQKGTEFKVLPLRGFRTAL
jgi:hypothetical protein